MLTGLSLLFVSATAQAPSPPPPSPVKPKLICRQGEQELGSHIRTSRICRTAEKWQREDARRDERPATYKVVPGQGDGVPRPQRPPL
ncbi:MAG TPA: hypothetical protein VF750_02050 [Sphingomicrobium sp.]